MLREFCQEHQLPYRELGKLIVATSDAELPGLADIEERSRHNGVPDVTRLGRRGIADVEPCATGVAALHSPRTAAVDYVAVCDTLAGEIKSAGGEVLLEREVTGITRVMASPWKAVAGPGISTGLSYCAGLHGDRFARPSGPLADTCG